MKMEYESAMNASAHRNPGRARAKSKGETHSAISALGGPDNNQLLRTQTPNVLNTLLFTI